MCFVTLEDRYGEIDCVVFPNMLETYGRLLVTDAAVAVRGKLSVKEGERPEIILSEVIPLTSDSQVAPSSSGSSASEERKKRLFLRLRSLESDECRMAMRILAKYPGDTAVAIYDSSSEKYVTVSDRRVLAEDGLLSALYRLLGRDNVILR